MSKQEAALLQSYGRLTLDHLAWVFLPIYGGFAFGLFGGRFVNWLIRKGGGLELQRLPIWSGTVIAAIGIVPAVWLYRTFAARRTTLRSDIANEQVEVIEVRDAEFVEQTEYNDEGPICYIDIGDGKLLFVWGQWMFDESIYTYAARSNLEREQEDQEDWPPFPSSAFVIHRVIESGQVLSIEILGEKLKPKRVIKSQDIPLSGHPDSLVMDGKLDDLKSAMANVTPRPERRKRPANR